MAESVNAKLEAAVNKLLDELDSLDDKGEPRYSLTNKCAVLDRALKLEAIKQKMRGDDWGGAFGDGEEETPPEPSDLPDEPDEAEPDE